MDLFLRGTPGVSKVDREWPKSHWPILGQLGGRSLVKKKKMVPANTFIPRQCSTRSRPSSTQSELSNDSASCMTHIVFKLLPVGWGCEGGTLCLNPSRVESEFPTGSSGCKPLWFPKPNSDFVGASVSSAGGLDVGLLSCS